MQFPRVRRVWRAAGTGGGLTSGLRGVKRKNEDAPGMTTAHNSFQGEGVTFFSPHALLAAGGRSAHTHTRQRAATWMM